MNLYDILDYFSFGPSSVSSTIILFFRFQFSCHCAAFCCDVCLCRISCSEATDYWLSRFWDIWGIPNPDPTKRWCVRKCLFGNVICTIGHGKYKVAFDDWSLWSVFWTDCMQRACLPLFHPMFFLHRQMLWLLVSPLGPKQTLKKRQIESLNPLRIHMKKKSIFFDRKMMKVMMRWKRMAQKRVRDNMIQRDKCPASYLLQKLRLKKWEHMLSARREQRSTFVSC